MLVFDSPTFICYLESLTGDVFNARFVKCQFDETVFPPLGGEKKINSERLVPKERRELSWNASTLSHLDPRTTQCDFEIKKILHL